MKYKVFFIIAYIVIVWSCKKEDKYELPEFNFTSEINVVVIKKTGNWCSYCPDGAKVMNNIVDKYGDNVVPIAVHGLNNDPMEISAFQSFLLDRPSGGFPSFFITEKRFGANQYECENAIVDKLKEELTAVIAINKNIADDKLLVDIKTKFLEDIDGEYHIAVYVNENNIDGGSNASDYKQVNGGDDFMHHHVLRATSFSGHFWGEKIADLPKADSEYTKSYSFEIEDFWKKENLEIAAVLWLYDENMQYKYSFVNAAMVK